MHLLFKQLGAGRENENWIGLKLAKTLDWAQTVQFPFKGHPQGEDEKIL